MSDFGVGLIGAGVAALFFGSNYIPTKNYPQGDGMTNVWVFSFGVLFVGIITMLTNVSNDSTTFVYSGILGGSLWATGNLCVIPIVKTIGLGLGMLLWGCTSLITGFLVGKAGLFGLHKQPVNEVLNWIGFSMIIAAMIVFFFIKPSLEEKEQKKDLNEYSSLLSEKSIQSSPAAVDDGKSLFDTIPTNLKSAVGIPLAVASGILYGFNVIPNSVWVQHETDNCRNPSVVAFILSHFVGIWLFSTIAFFVYVGYMKVKYNKAPQVFPESIIPAFISGSMWGVAQIGLLVASSKCGLAIGFPVGSAGPLIISSLWSVLYFREITGTRNIAVLVTSFVFLGTGIALLALSNKSSPAIPCPK